MHKGHWLKIAIITVALLSLPITAYAMSPSDASITLKAKTALYLATDVKGTAINVDTINGRLTLHGTVNDAKEKTRATELVSKIEGVIDVRNLLRVAPPSKDSATIKRSDDLIKQDVGTRLKADSSLDDSSIIVRSVYKGDVTLSGNATSLNDYQRALYCAATAPGVSHVASEISVSDTLSDDDFRTDKVQKADTDNRNVGGVVSDLWLTSATKMKLAVDSRTPATEINVDSHNGIVTLFGMVPSQDSKTAAGEIAQGVSGVISVDNQIEVVSARKTDMVQARDEEIHDGVTQALHDRGEQENADIGVEVKNGVVRLTGTVPSWQRNLSVVYVARSVTGVRSILNELMVVSKSAAKS
jgi:hyperosmotically inducible protein